MKYLILLLSIMMFSGCAGISSNTAFDKAQEDFRANRINLFTANKQAFQQIHSDIKHVEEVGMIVVSEALYLIDNSKVKDPYKLIADKVAVTGLSFQVVKETNSELDYFIGKNGLNYIFSTGLTDKKPKFTGYILSSDLKTGYQFGATTSWKHQKYINAVTVQPYNTYDAQYGATGLVAKSALSLPPTVSDVQAAINKKAFNFEDFYRLEGNKTRFSLSVWQGPSWGDMADNQDMEFVGTRRPKTKSDVESILQKAKNSMMENGKRY